MKWIGQHIWDFISRFRNDVYLEKVESEAAPDANSFLALKDGKIVKTSGGTGGSIAVEEVDGDPNPATVNKIIVSNGSLTDNEDGSVTIDVGGGGGGDITSDDHWDEKGDLIVGTGDNTASHLDVGDTDGHVLTVDSTNGTHGINWKAPVNQGITIVNANGSIDSDESALLTNITTLTFLGDDVQTFSNGDGNALINMDDDAVQFAPSFSISYQDAYLTLSGTNYQIANPDSTASAGSNFWAGTYAGTSQEATRDTSTTVHTGSTLVGGMENDPTIEVKVYGPRATNNNGSSTVLATCTHTVNGNGSTSAQGITITISEETADVISSRRKAKVTVVIDHTHANISDVSGDYDGSQAINKITVRHLDSTGAELGSYTSGDFFYDNDNSDSSPGTLTLTFDPNSNVTTKTISNIAYYSDDSDVWRLTLTNSTNLIRNTANNSFPSDCVEITGGTNHYVVNGTIEPDVFASDGTAFDKSNNNNSNKAEGNMGISNNKFYLDHEATFKARTGASTGVGRTASDWTADLTDDARNYHTQDSGSDVLSEYFQCEEYRLNNDKTAGDTNALTNSIWLDDTTYTSSSSDTDWLTQTVVNTGKELDTNDEHLICGKWSGVWQLRHPQQIGTVAALPSHSWVNPGNGTYEYIRFFYISGSATASVNVKIPYFTLTELENFAGDAYEYASKESGVLDSTSQLKIYFAIPSTSSDAWMGRWIPLHISYDSNNKENGLRYNTTSHEQADTNNDADQYNYDLQFGSSSNVFLMKIIMDETLGNNSRIRSSIIMSNGHVHG